MGTDKTIYIHMGMYKTGTKSIQFFFTENREFFIKKGVYYPYSKGIDFYRHKSFFPVVEGKIKKVIKFAEKHNCRTIVLSSDSLCKSGISDMCHEKIKRLAPDYRVKYVIYIKRIDDIVKDWYNESRKRNYSTENYRKFIESHYSNHRSILFPSRLLEHCIRQIGKDDVIIRDYSAVKDTVRDFCSLIGVSLDAEMAPKKVYNPSSPHNAIPYYTQSIFSKIPHGYVEVQLHRKIQDAFSNRHCDAINEKVIESLQDEIDHIQSEYLPGYKNSFSERPLCLEFPEAEADPFQIYVADLLHSIYRRITWPERLLWRIGSVFYLLLIQIPLFQKYLLKHIPFVERKISS